MHQYAIFGEFQDAPEDKTKLLRQGIIPIVELLEVSPHMNVITEVLRLVNQVLLFFFFC